LSGAERRLAGTPKPRFLWETVASRPLASGVAFVSDRLDIVRLIDAKVTASRRTVVRSKQLADAAKDDLTTHEQWLEGHRQRSQQDLERHQRRLRFRRMFETGKRVAISVVLFVPSVCIALYRGVARSLRAIDELAFAGCSWIGAKAYGLGRSLIGAFASGIAWVAANSLALGVWVSGGLWLSLSWLGAGARDVGLTLLGASSSGLSWFGVSARDGGLTLFDALSRGLSWLGPKTESFGRLLIELLALSLARLAVIARSLGLRLWGWIEGQGAQLVTRFATNAEAPVPKRADTLDPRRLQEAAFVRLRAEHERLQARIHAMDRHFGRRVADGRRADGAEWAQLRQLALNARRLFEIQEGQVRGPLASRGSGGSRPPRRTRVTEIAGIHALRAGHAIYEAPALVAGRRRARP